MGLRALKVDITGDKEGVSATNGRDRGVIQCGQSLHRGTLRHSVERHLLQRPQLNVLRAIAVRVLNAHRETAFPHIADVAVEAVATAGVQVDAEHAHRRARREFAAGRVFGVGSSGDVQLPGIGGLDKTRLGVQQTCPWPALSVHGADDQVRQVLVELTVLIGHVVANDALAQGFHALCNADFGLQSALAGMPWRCRFSANLVHGANSLESRMIT